MMQTCRTARSAQLAAQLLHGSPVSGSIRSFHSLHSFHLSTLGQLNRKIFSLSSNNGFHHSAAPWSAKSNEKYPTGVLDLPGTKSGDGEKTARSDVAAEVDDKALPHFKIQQEIRKLDSAKKAEFRYPDPEELIPKEPPGVGVETLPHPIWSKEELDSVVIAHKKPEGFVDWTAYIAVQTLRKSFDLLSGYTFGTKNEANWLRRIIFLETVAGVPGMMGAMVRHLKSLRSMKRDYGWIHTLLEEAENERMHLMVALQIKEPGKLFRFGVMASQGLFVNFFFLAYLVSPKFCHRFVGYLEEEAVKTYTALLQHIAEGGIPEWTNRPAPDVAKVYWKLPADATFYEMFAAIRADEAHHRLVNHTLSSMQADKYNPFKPGH